MIEMTVIVTVLFALGLVFSFVLVPSLGLLFLGLSLVIFIYFERGIKNIMIIISKLIALKSKLKPDKK